MKHGAGIAMGALALIVGGAAILRAGRSGATPEASESGSPSSVERAAAGASPDAIRSTGSLPPGSSEPEIDPSAPPASKATFRMSQTASGIARKIEANRVSGIALTPQEQAEIRVQEEALARQGTELAEHLRNEPGGWPDVIARMGSMEDRNGAFRAVGALSSAMDGAGEAHFRELLRSGAGPNARLIAVHALSGRDSSDVLTALLSSAEGDPDPRVRLGALKALVQRRQRTSGSPDQVITIEGAVRRRSQVDENAEVRAIAAKLLPGVQPQPPPPAARKSPLGRRPGSP